MLVVAELRLKQQGNSAKNINSMKKYYKERRVLKLASFFIKETHTRKGTLFYKIAKKRLCSTNRNPIYESN